VYLGVVPLTRDHDGRLEVDGSGDIVDWLVKMLRLPADTLMSTLLERHALTAVHLRQLAERLAAFHRTQAPVMPPAAEYLDRLRGQILASQPILADPRWRLPAGRVEKSVPCAAAMAGPTSPCPAGTTGAGSRARGSW
jgi:hypothetical protein